uniref:GIT1 n=1 Tax=Haemonchus contortus TaxID=6289 RepID=A0A7I5EEK4_HAECO
MSLPIGEHQTSLEKESLQGKRGPCKAKPHPEGAAGSRVQGLFVLMEKEEKEPLLVSQDDKGVPSNENAARNDFYAIVDSIRTISQKQDRMEDRLRRIDERTTAIERLLQQGSLKLMAPSVDA